LAPGTARRPGSGTRASSRAPAPACRASRSSAARRRCSAASPSNVGDIDARFNAGEEVNVETLRAKGLAKKSLDGVRILGTGDVTKKLVIKAHHFSKSAKEKVEGKGGKCDLIPPPKKPVRNKMKPRPAKDQQG
jgi:ribosomal protein L15